MREHNSQRTGRNRIRPMGWNGNDIDERDGEGMGFPQTKVSKGTHKHQDEGTGITSTKVKGEERKMHSHKSRVVHTTSAFVMFTQIQECSHNHTDLSQNVHIVPKTFKQLWELFAKY